MTFLNRRIRGRRVQVIGHVRVFSCDYTVREWLHDVKRRGRGYWPRTGLWPIFHYWTLGPFELRIFTARAMKESRL